MCEISSKLTIKTSERRHRSRSGVFIVNFKTDFTHCSGISIVDFKQVNAGWVTIFAQTSILDV